MAFAPVASVDASALRWLRDGDRPLKFVLSAGERPIASLTWQKEAGSLATSESSAGSWQLKRSGFLNPQITVRPSGGTRPVARLTVHLNYHAIEVVGGATYRFHRAGVLLPAWKVTGPDGAEVLHLEPVREGRSLTGGAVLASPGAATHPEFLLVVVLSWYFIVLAWFEDEALIPFEGPALSVAPQP
jgi:hypothetical protein